MHLSPITERYPTSEVRTLVTTMLSTAELLGPPIGDHMFAKCFRDSSPNGNNVGRQTDTLGSLSKIE